MNSLNIDFRGESLRILTVRDGQVKHAGLTKDFRISDPKAAKDLLLKAVSDAGAKKGKVNVILPSRIVKFNTYQLPAMDIEDAQKVVKREISKEVGQQAFAMGVRRILKNIPGRQEILAEYVLISELKPYIELLKTCGLKPSVLTTSLEGIINLFNRIKPETAGNEAILEIGQTFIEIIVFNNGKLINYKKVQMPPVNDEKLTGQDLDHDQIIKIKMYTIVDALYNFIIETGSGSEEEKISRLWISGLGSIEQGTTGVITEGLGVDCSPMNPFDTDIDNAGIYTALAGLSMLTQADRIINLLPEDIRRSKSILINRAVLASSLIFYAILVSGGYLILKNAEKDIRAIYDKSSAELTALKQTMTGKGLNYHDETKKILESSRDFHAAFRDIANVIPPEISLTAMDIEKTQDQVLMRLSATVRTGNEGLRAASISGFIKSLEDTGRFRLTAPPDISASTQETVKQVYSLKVSFEVLK